MQGATTFLKVVQVRQDPQDSTCIILVATDASLTDVFHTVSLNMTATIPAADHKPQPMPAAAVRASGIPHQPRRKLQTSSLDLGGALKSVQAKIHSLGDDVDALIGTIQAVEQAFENGGNYQRSNQQSVSLYSFNVDNTTHAGPQCQFALDQVLSKSRGSVSADVGYSGTCQNCYAYIGVTVTASINIQQGQLIGGSVIMDGTANFQSTFDLTLNQTDIDVDGHITTLNAGPIQFMLGPVPIRLTSTTPINLGITGTVKGNLHMTGDLGMAASVKAGFQFANSQTQFINQLDFDHSGSGIHLPSLSSITDSVALRFYVLPVPFINFDYLGGPNVGLKTYLEGIVDFDQPPCSRGPSVVTNAGLDGTVGANVHIGVGSFAYKRNFSSLATFSLHHAASPLYCPFGSANSGRRLQQVPALGPWARVGNVWQGKQVYTGAGHRCQPSQYPPFVVASLQLVKVTQTGSGPLIDFVATINSGATDFSGSGYAQLNQQFYTLSCYVGGSCTFSATDDAVNYVGASQGGTGAATLQPQYGNFDWEHAGTVIALQDTSLCVVTNLTLVTPQPSQSSTPAAAVPTALSSTCPWATTSAAIASVVPPAGMVLQSVQ